RANTVGDTVRAVASARIQEVDLKTLARPGTSLSPLPRPPSRDSIGPSCRPARPAQSHRAPPPHLVAAMCQATPAALRSGWLHRSRASGLDQRKLSRPWAAQRFSPCLAPAERRRTE